jgi:hypothetical protein
MNLKFNNNFNCRSSGFDRVDVSAGFPTGEPGSVNFDQMSILNVNEAGYAFIYVSNENPRTGFFRRYNFGNKIGL